MEKENRKPVNELILKAIRAMVQEDGVDPQTLEDGAKEALKAKIIDVDFFNDIMIAIYGE